MKKMRVMALLLALLMGAPQVAGAATGEMPEIREMSEAGEREEQGAGAHFALLRADVDPAGTPGMYLVKLEIANLSYEDEDVSFSLDDPDGHVRNADEIAGTLQFYGKTIKQYAFLMRIPVPKKPTDMPFAFVVQGKNGAERLPFHIAFAPDGLAPRLFMPAATSPVGAMPGASSSMALRLANKGAKTMENVTVRAFSQGPVALENDTIEIGTLEAGKMISRPVAFTLGEGATTNYVPVYYEVTYTVDGTEYKDNFTMLVVSGTNEDPESLSQSANWSREQMRRAADGEIPPKPDNNGNGGGQNGGGQNGGGQNGGGNGQNGGGENGGGSVSVGNKPKLIVSKYEFSKKPITAGEEFEMSLTFFNTNKTKKVTNIKIFLTSDAAQAPEGQGTASSGGNVFTPVDSSNTFYIDEIAPKSYVTKSIKLAADATAAAKNYTMVANFEYEDTQGNEFTAKELIGIPVTQSSRLSSSSVHMDDAIFAGQPTSVGLDFYNTGKVTLYNLFVSFEGDLKTEGTGEYFVGNFQSGSQDSYEVTLTPDAPGTAKGKIVFTYEDAAGNPKREEKEIEMNVEEMQMPNPEDMGEMPQEIDERPFYLKPLFYIGLPLLLIALIVVIVVVKKRKKKKADALKLDE